jgi:hypothetical protein
MWPCSSYWTEDPVRFPEGKLRLEVQPQGRGSLLPHLYTLAQGQGWRPWGEG